MSVSAVQSITVLSPFPSSSSPKAGNSAGENTSWGPATRVEVTNRETIEEAQARTKADFERDTPPDVRARLIAQQGRGGGGFGPSTAELKQYVSELSDRMARQSDVENPDMLDRLTKAFGAYRAENLLKVMTQQYQETKARFDSLSAMLAARLEQEAEGGAGGSTSTA